MSWIHDSVCLCVHTLTFSFVVMKKKKKKVKRFLSGGLCFSTVPISGHSLDKHSAYGIEWCSEVKASSSRAKTTLTQLSAGMRGALLCAPGTDLIRKNDKALWLCISGCANMKRTHTVPSSLSKTHFTHPFPPAQQFLVITETAAPPPPSALREWTRHKSVANLLKVNCDPCQVIALAHRGPISSAPVVRERDRVEKRSYKMVMITIHTLFVSSGMISVLNQSLWWHKPSW